MKKFLTISLAASLLVACDDKENGGGPTNTGYPTDNLTLTPEKSTLVLFSYEPTNSSMAEYEQMRLMAEDFYEDRVNYMSLVSNSNEPLFTETGDSLVDQLAMTSAPEFFVNTDPVEEEDFFDELETKTSFTKVPVASVKHKVTRTDSAWLVDCKVKFWKDTLGSSFYVQTYFLANVPAANYSAMDLDMRIGNAGSIVGSDDTLSRWTNDVVSTLDTGKVVAEQDEQYIHPYVAIDHFAENSVFGLPLSEYTPFGHRFFENDIIGTRSTPIRHYFLRPGYDEDYDDEMEYEFEPAFLTVIWHKVSSATRPEYVNSYMSVSRR